MNARLTRILLIEDNPSEARLIQEMLNEAGSGQFHLEVAGQLSTGLGYLADQCPDVVLLDLGLPDSQGLNTLARVYASAPEIPIVILTGLNDESVGVAAVKQGAQDYLVKRRVDGKVLWRVMNYAIQRKNMEAQLVARDRLASIGQLVSGVTHELNNPLTSVIGFSELLLERELPDNIRMNLKIINDEAHRMDVIVKKLLTFARRQPQEKRPMDINESIQAVLELRAHEQKTSNIKVNTRFAPDLPQIMGNNSQLQQVFLNIIINAEFFMSEVHGRGTMTITTERIGDSVRVSLADDGPGISKESMNCLFTPFFTTREVGQGAGLGLSICHGIITKHGGRIYAESESGKGATFIIELPIRQEERDEGGLT